MDLNGIANDDTGDNEPKIFLFTKEDINAQIAQSADYHLDEMANTKEKLEDGIITYSIFNSLSDGMQTTVGSRFEILSDLLGIEFQNIDFESSQLYPELKVKDFSFNDYLRDRTLTKSDENTIGRADSSFTIKLNQWDYDNETFFIPDYKFAITANHEVFHLLGLGHTENMAPLIGELAEKFHISSMNGAQLIFDPQIGVLDIFTLEKNLGIQTNYLDYFKNQSDYSQYEIIHENGKNILNINFNLGTYTRDFVLVEMPRNGDLAIISEYGEVVIPGVIGSNYDGVKFTFVEGPLADSSLSKQDYMQLDKVVESQVFWKSGDSLTMSDVAASINDGLQTAQQTLSWFDSAYNVYPPQDYSSEMMSHIYSPQTSAPKGVQLLEADPTEIALQSDVRMGVHKATRTRNS